jgi:O-antigen ligase
MNMPDIIPIKWYWRLATVVTGTIVINSIAYIITNAPHSIVLWEMLLQFPILACVWMPWLVFPLVCLAIWWIVDTRRRFFIPLVYFGIITAVAILTIITEAEAKRMNAERAKELEFLMEEMEDDLDGEGRVEGDSP